MSKVDLSYKINAKKAWYDIEILEDVFTMVIVSPGHVRFVSIEAPYYQSNTDEQIESALREMVEITDRAKDVIGDDYSVSLLRAATNDKLSLIRVQSLIDEMIKCHDIDDGESFTEYYGWNSSRYDIPMLIAISTRLMSALDENLCHDFKSYSDALIGYDGPPWGQMKHLAGVVADNTRPASSRQMIKKSRLADWSDGHIDLALIARSDGDDDPKFPPGLKKEEARYGLDIVIDEAVSNGSSHLSHEEFIKLCQYNLHDVIATALIGQNSIIAAGIQTRDIVRRMYPYTSARSVKLDSNRTIPTRDVTAAQLAGLVLVGENKSRPQDARTVNFKFPVANGSTVDLLDFMAEHEAYMPPRIYQFFAHFRGKDTTTSKQDWEVKQSQPVTHSSAMNCPYYRDGKPVDSYIRVSTGGAHGSVMAGLHEFTPDEVDNWIVSDAGATESQKPTVDVQDVIHVDWSSFYPVMASKLQMYKTSDNVDRYTGIIEYRFDIKDRLPHRRDEWTEEHYLLQEEQMGLKFILNNATGAGNMHQKYALLPIDNKTLSMRLIGNMHIWCLAQRMTQAGGFVVSTNTDGIYVAGLTLDQAQQVIDDYLSLYGMGVEPEIVDRFINRDTSNRIEYQGDTMVAVNGRLRHGKDMFYTDAAIGRNVPYPIVAAHAALEYMRDPEWLSTPYDRDRLRQIVEKLHAESTTPEAWYHVHIGSGKRRLTFDGVMQGRINRCVMTLSGSELGLASRRKLTKQESIDVASSELPLADALKSLGINVANELTDDCTLTLVDVIKPKFDDPYTQEISGAEYSLDQFRSGRGSLSGTLGVKYSDGSVEVLEAWKSGSLTGYTSSTGVLLNSSKSLREFDMSTLDLEAYTQWAEDLLKPWKLTADLPDVGMKSIDDGFGRQSSVRGRRGNRIEREVAKIEAAYSFIRSNDSI